MKKDEIMDELVKSIINFEVDNVKEITLKAIKLGISPYTIIENGISKGLETIGNEFENKRAFLPELIAAGFTAKEGLKILKPHLKKEKTKTTGIVVIGTVKGDLHDIGKNIVISMLESSGFEIHDLGVDVQAEKFAEEIQKTNADILALSALLTTTMPELKKVIKILEKKGLRKKIKIMVGGRPLTYEFSKEIGADFYCKDAIDGLKRAKHIMSDKKY